MKKLFLLFIVSAALVSFAEEKNLSIKIQDVIVPFGDTLQSKEVSFAAVPSKKGMIPVLKVRIFNKYPMPAGWNNSNRFYINGKRLDRYTYDGKERLLFRGRTLKFTKGSRPYFSNSGWLIFFCNGERLDKRIVSDTKEKCWYYFDISDVIYTSKENKFKASTFNLQKSFKRQISLHAVDAEIVYLPEKEVENARAK